MNIQYWLNLIVSAVNNPDPDQLNSLANHMAACEEANSILRSKGYGASGQAINDVVRGVPHARD